jgi:glutamine synthetase
MMNLQPLLEQIDRDRCEHLWVIWHDYGGRACAKTIPKAKIASAFEHGVVFARADLDFTFEDHMAAGSVFTAETGDFLAVPDPASYAPIPYHTAAARMHAFLRADDGSEWEGCPRTRLQRIIGLYAEQGLSLRAGFEAEFNLFTPSGEGEYQPADHDGMFTAAGLDRHFDFLKNIIDTLQSMGVIVEQLGKEYGPGQYEATTRYDTPLKAVDDYLTFKDVVRALARRAGWVASFMPKPYAHLPGCGLHLHLSLWDAGGRDHRGGQRDLSMGQADQEALSPLGMHFLGGLLAHAPALTGVGSPIVNSYKRLLPGSWAPAHICWGVGNRAALVRIPGMGRRRHLEYRSGDNAANPYLFLTAIMAAGLDGIHRQIVPPAPVSDDVGSLAALEQATARGIHFLPRTLPEALNALESDPIVAEALGPTILTEFLKVKRTELAAYDLHVHPWERKTYLEVV